MALESPLLTIAIPTYNRAKFLDRALHYIYIQIKDKDYPLEIIVSDNGSSDNTFTIVEEYCKKGLEIRYIKNIENKGADYNIAQCYLEAKGKYVVAFGDDDIFINGSIDKILKVLSLDDFGVIFLRSKELKQDVLCECLVQDVKFSEFKDGISFIRKVNYYVTFISSNIINTKYLNREKLLKYNGTSLIQLSFVLDAALSSKTNVYMLDSLIAAETDNTGGYHLFKVFGENLFSILKSYDNRLEKILADRLLLEFFPYWILFLKSHKSDFYQEDPLISLEKVFGSYFYFKVFIYPLIKLPLLLAKPMYKIIRVYYKIYSRLKRN